MPSVTAITNCLIWVPVCDRHHGGAGSSELSVGRISNWMVRLLSLKEKIMSKTTHNAKVCEFADEITESELENVSVGSENLPIAIWHHLLGQLGVGEPTYRFSAKMKNDLAGC